ncbi:lipase secretion chaperone [Alloalcanivorax gelatiniphagus]|uniref:Lipase chaperone n=1 Tax=Alloalcanivorax gelatiniphagus TaxID=1194167 RepID=A0ABY2XNC9_9GAMM|nr:lipase secretion chaperone [Alloalcanivorax gelatiniphagus]TMW13941.1 hypothetical protein FGS76_04920 [Alloalcanivorax gelatiniphagus]
MSEARDRAGLAAGSVVAAVVLALASAVLVAGVVWLVVTAPPESPVEPAINRPGPEPVEAVAAEPVVPSPPPRRPPASTDSTESAEPLAPERLDQLLTAFAWEGDRLRVDHGTRRTLNALLAGSSPALGERILTRLPDPRGRQVVDLLERYRQYLDMRQAVADTFDYLDNPEAMAGAQRQLHQLRRDYLGAELARGLFGEEERMVNATLENMRIQSDPTLSDARKRELTRPIKAPGAE